MPRLLLVVVAVLAGCVGLDSAVVDLERGAVVGGAPSTDDPAVVLVLIPGEGGCTGVAIAPRVVLTAEHCVTGTDASQWRVLVGYEPGPIETREAEYLVTEIRSTGAHDLENDLAIMILDSDFEFPTYRHAFATPSSVAVGASVRYVGFGNTVAGDNSSAGTRNQRSGTLSAVEAGSLRAVVGVCAGDSGGPLLDPDNIVLGVAHDIVMPDCSGEARFTRLEPWRDMIAAALADTGACVPDSWVEVCIDGRDNECNGAVDDGCEADGDADTDVDIDADADVDADGDSDADVDADVDADTDADVDTDVDSDSDADGDGDPDDSPPDGDWETDGGGQPMEGGTCSCDAAGHRRPSPRWLLRAL